MAGARRPGLCWDGIGGVHKLIGSLVIALVAVACGEAAATPPPGPDTSELLIRQSPSPFQQVSAGPVSALIPDAWEPALAGPIDDPRQGIVAAPPTQDWRADRPPLEGLAAMWIDGTAIGVPSDYYYLAATGPALDDLTGSEQCRATRRYVVAKHLPAFAQGPVARRGDEVGPPGRSVADRAGAETVGHVIAG